MISNSRTRWQSLRYGTHLTLLLSSLLFIHTSFAAPAGKTLMSRGQVVATASDSAAQRTLKRRSPVFDVDVVNTGQQSNAQLRMQDGALIALKENTQLIINEYTGASEEDGSVVMELVTGGLRTITGKIKGNKDNYQLRTPVGSIGIRGTHYEVEWQGDTLLLAVWDGTIEVDINDQPLLLGQEGNFSFASVSQSGEVTPLLAPPQQLSRLTPSSQAATGGADPDTQDDAANTSDTSELPDSPAETTTLAIAQAPVATAPATEAAFEAALPDIGRDISENSFITEENLDTVGIDPLEELLAERTGTALYSELERAEFSSSEGAVSNIQMQISIDFDSGTVPQGVLSFNDQQGEWFAAFNGLIDASGMTLGVNFASHGQNLAEGTIDTQFSDELNKLRGNFNLNEIDEPSVTASGLFILSQP
ncbi:FecR family protein [Pseudoalteromonas sp. OOF1S-7]|uniref:FecR family protein n=1 Tax=Pseudoalteromonas sp. OOF1S-7 TaxID=2917757 RepID=UPI001EF6257F|nr:FecR family protein [Pseudoalteromonas sp. OOF1S-7]MCG7536082.1 FecR family protein [Pseudoalteromonas sp. OOF1S-7]